MAGIVICKLWHCSYCISLMARRGLNKELLHYTMLEKRTIEKSSLICLDLNVILYEFK